MLEHQSHCPLRYSNSSKDGEHTTSAGSLSLTQLVTGEGSCGGCKTRSGWSEEVSVKWQLSKDLQVMTECKVGLYGEEKVLSAEGWSERTPLRLGVVSTRNCRIQRRSWSGGARWFRVVLLKVWARDPGVPQKLLGDPRNFKKCFVIILRSYLPFFFFLLLFCFSIQWSFPETIWYVIFW